MDALEYTPAWMLAEMVRQRRVSPVELTEHLLRRIERLNPRLNAYLTVAHQKALAAAQAAEAALRRGAGLGPLHGVPISIKDLLQTRDMPTTGGSLVFRESVPGEDAVVVERLRQAGAIILGKTNTPEFGLSATTENRLGDHCRNPWDTARTSGGSSGGAAAAVAAGLCPIAIGSDGGGSIRVPSAFCGVFGIKPTYGLVPQHGGFGGMALFAGVGPITRTVRDAALCLNIIAGHHPADPASLRQRPADFLAGLDASVKGLRVAWSPDLGLATVDPEVKEIARSAAYALEGLGCSVEEAAPDAGEPFAIHNLITMTDEYAAVGHLLEKHADQLVTHVRVVLERGSQVPAYEYSRALRSLERFRMRMADFFDRYDLLLTPATAVPAFPVGQRPRTIAGKEVDRMWGPFPFAPAFNLTGQPAASVPCGFTSQGLPVGLQVVARWGEDATLLRACAALEKARPWAHKVPPLDAPAA